MKELADIRLPVVVPPAADDRADGRDHVAQPHGRLSSCQVPYLVFEPVHRSRARDGIQIEWVGLGGSLVGGHPKSLAPLNFVSEELDPVSYMYDAGLLRMQADAELLLQECFRQRQRGFGVLTRVANDDEVIRKPRQPVAGFGHGMVKRREIDIRPQRAGYTSLRNSRPSRFPRSIHHHPCFEKTTDQSQHRSIADLLADQAHQAVLVNAVKIGFQVGVQNPQVSLVDLTPHLPHRLMRRAARTISERTVRKQWLKDRIHLLNQCLLYDSVTDRRNTQISGTPCSLRYRDPLDWLRPIGPLAKLLVEPTKQFVLSFRKSGDRHAVNAGATPVLPDPLPGFLQIVWIVDFVDQRMDFPVPRLPFSSVGQRVPGILDNGAGSFEPRTYPHFRHVLPRSPVFRLATQHGAFPLRPAFWVRPASPFDDDDPKPFALTSFKSTMPRSDSWHCIGRNFAFAYIRTYRRRLQAGLRVLCLLALSSASVALFQPYLPFGQYQASLSH